MTTSQTERTDMEDHADYNSRIEAMRKDEFPMLKGDVYLDHAGTTLPAKSLTATFATEISTLLIGNPHSTSTSSQLSTSRIEDARIHVLELFSADPAEFDVVFVANATAGIKLVAEAFRGLPDGFDYIYHQASHTSLVGVRQEARTSVCLDDAATVDWLDSLNSSGGVHPTRPALFAYPAQSNLDGHRLPLDWCRVPRLPSDSNQQGQVFTLLDAAAFVSTSPLDLSVPEHAPDFTVLSFYKIFGFPDLGALIVKRRSAHILLQRKYFGGGTVDSVVCGPDEWHARKSQSAHEALEDGTLPIHSIMALEIAMSTHLRLFGTMQNVSRHTSYLSHNLRQRLKAMRHGNGARVCVVYSQDSKQPNEIGSGPVIAFNLKTKDGSWVTLTEFQKLASLQGFHLRTGGVCNPGGISAALDLQSWEVKRNYAQGFRCGDNNDVINNKPTGVIRVSLGAMSIMSDVDKFVAFIQEFYLTEPATALSRSSIACNRDTSTGSVKEIIVYPIKSCQGFHVPQNIPWQVRPEGLMWDREWCLVHCGTGRALSQKRYPRMALLQPTINLDTGTLEVSFNGYTPNGQLESISVPLADDTKSTSTSLQWVVSKVCAEDICVQRYTSHRVNNFFSNALGVPCVLARHSPNKTNIKGKRRFGKSLQCPFQKPQRLDHYPMPGGFPVSAYTESRSSMNTGDFKLLLSNESPILAITTSSLQALNEDIEARGGYPVRADVFRANIVIDSNQYSAPYSEDGWSDLQIDGTRFTVLGPCQRCHMVCIDPKTGVKGAEPFVTLSKTRRFDGKVWFGIHLTMEENADSACIPGQTRLVKVGDNILGQKL